ncbi:MAG: family 43 glycosylhydrolase [Clostridia bacterium]|nr:family 43 glycosylhydrolase [Clostridia bacterium]
MLTRDEIRIRDPFILTDTAHGCYYMYGTTALEPGSIAAKNSFMVYKTRDLENFEEGKVVFDGANTDFWGTYDFWAPEVHVWRGKYYLLGSCKAETRHRGTQIFVCDTPDGTFVPVSDRAATPAEWECLDGTLYVEDGVPYLVFSHEWTQVGDGEICAVRLSDDLSRAIGEPFLLFRASDNPDVSEIQHTGSGKYVTDGPFLYQEDGKLRMIWSSFYRGRYLVLEAEADSLRGAWMHHGSRFDFDGGHAMVFYTLEGDRMISLHRPNEPHGAERATFFKY